MIMRPIVVGMMCATAPACSLHVPTHGFPRLGRRLAAQTVALALGTACAPVCLADTSPVVLTEEEMAARVRRKQELLRQRQGAVRSTEVKP